MDSLGQAQAALDLAYTDPSRARRLASTLPGGDREAAAVAQRALGLACSALGLLDDAEGHLRAAIDIAEGAGLFSRAAETRGSFAYVLTLIGRTREALAEIDRAAPVLAGTAAARLRMQRALVLTEISRFAEAAVDFAAALRLLATAGGDGLLEASIRTNRSILRVHQRDWRGADDDLDRAETLYVETGHSGRIAMVWHNRGLAAAVRGDIPAALRAYDEAADRYRAAGRDPGLLAIERAESLLSVHLVDEAREVAAAAVEEFTRRRNAVDLVQARIVLAQAALLDGDTATARTQARRAAAAAARQHRAGWAALAGYVDLRARFDEGDHTEAALRYARRSANALDAAGWGVPALDARVIAARIALGLGHVTAARRDLAQARYARRDDPAEVRSRTGDAIGNGAADLGSDVGHPGQDRRAEGGSGVGRPGQDGRVGGGSGVGHPGRDGRVEGGSDVGHSGHDGPAEGGSGTEDLRREDPTEMQSGAEHPRQDGPAELRPGTEAPSRDGATQPRSRARHLRRDGPAELRARAWYAEALLRLSHGDRRGADAALRAGMLVLERFRATLGATELRAHASGHGEELARLGVRLAIETGRARSVLTWSERGRASALRLRPVRPPTDPALAADLADLRQVAADAARAAAEGGDTRTLLRRQATLERRVRDRSRHAAGEPGAVPVPTPEALAGALKTTTLVEYLDVGGTLHAVVVAAGRIRLQRLGPAADVARELDALRFGLRGMAYQIGSSGERVVAAAARRLDDLLLPDIGDGPLVLVPTGVLHELPWAALPSCSDRPFSVAPSAALWLRAASSPPGNDRRVLVSGPGLPGAATEIAALARRYPGADRFSGRRAKVGPVTAALSGAGLAHLAAHGDFRADNPLFSALRLADGPLTVYDLERLPSPPRHVVLSACDSGLPVVRPGDELLGLAAALLAMGTRSLIATVIPVPDRASRPLMLALHRHLAAGHEPAAALRLARQAAAPDPAARAAALGFGCFGAG